MLAERENLCEECGAYADECIEEIAAVLHGRV
jgi:hypothetical protein